MLTEVSILPIQTSYTIDEKTITATVLHEEPLIVWFENVLSEAECDSLIELSRNRLQRSKIANKEESQIRTSSGMFFEERENAFIDCIERRVSALMHVPLHHCEGLQILHYEPGQKFEAHYDYFGLQHPSSNNNRISTLIMYLNEVEQGGATTFPKLNLEVTPKKGMALYFEYFYQNEQLNELTLHSGEPVIAGEKWVATQWVRKQSIRER